MKGTELGEWEGCICCSAREPCGLGRGAQPGQGWMLGTQGGSKQLQPETGRSPITEEEEAL